MINDLNHHYNGNNGSEYVPDDSDEDDNILWSWESECIAMDEEEVIIVTYDDISNDGDINDH